MYMLGDGDLCRISIDVFDILAGLTMGFTCMGSSFLYSK